MVFRTFCAWSAQHSYKSSYRRRITDLANRKSALRLWNPDLSGAAGRNFPPFPIQNIEPASRGACIHSFKEWIKLFSFFMYPEKKAEWWFWPLYDKSLLKRRARKWEFAAYLRIETSLTIRLSGHSRYRNLCFWAEKNAKVMQPRERTSDDTTTSVVRAPIGNRKALYNISNPKTFFCIILNVSPSLF